jgi:enoyl-CoA hydratase
MDLVSYDLAHGVATITMDDGNANVISSAMQAEVNAALDRAEADRAVVVFAGRPGRFSGGFDLGTLAAGGDASAAMVTGGWALAARLMTFPEPVVVACTGHAIGIGALLLCAADYRFGAAGDYKINANEVAIGITMPDAGAALLRDRLTPAALARAVILAEVFTPDTAVVAGWLDRVVPPEELFGAAGEHARALGALNRSAHHATKLRMRQSTLDVLLAGPATLGL